MIRAIASKSKEHSLINMLCIEGKLTYIPDAPSPLLSHFFIYNLIQFFVFRINVNLYPNR